MVVTDNGSNMKTCFNLKEIGLDDDWKEHFKDAKKFNDINADSEEDSDWEPESEDESEDDTSGDDQENRETAASVLQQFASEMFNPASALPINGHLFCASHTLQLAINAGLNSSPSAKQMLIYINSIMKFLKTSVKWRDEMRKSTSLCPRLNVKTRWNSSLDMISRFQDVRMFYGVINILEC